MMEEWKRLLFQWKSNEFYFANEVFLVYLPEVTSSTQGFVNTLPLPSPTLFQKFKTFL